MGLGVWAYVLFPDGEPIFYVDHVSCASDVFWNCLFRFDLCRATFDLVVILGVIPVVAAAVVVFANGRRINSRLFTPGILWSASPW